MNDGVLKRAGQTITVAATNNATVTTRWLAPCAGSLKFLDLLAPGSAPASAAGTYLFTAANGATNLLAATNFDLETLVADTVSNPTLSATPANLDFEEGAVLVFSFVSNNADMTGPDELSLGIRYHRR